MGCRPPRVDDNQLTMPRPAPLCQLRGIELCENLVDQIAPSQAFRRFVPAGCFRGCVAG